METRLIQSHVLNIIHCAPYQGSGLAPGSYNNTGSINEVVDRVVSKRGPYDITTGARIPANKQDAANIHRSPCSYEIQPFTAILNGGYIILVTVMIHSLSYCM